jgi:hypothetical protein
LSLHAIGISAEFAKKRRELLQNNLDVKKEKNHTISTRVSPACANHSYNGVIWDIQCKGPFEIDVTSIHVGGMLGRVVSYISPSFA